jgi:hypothetical protein
MSRSGAMTDSETFHTDGYGVPPSLEPIPMPEAWPTLRPRYTPSVAIRVAVAIVVAASVAFVLVEIFPGTHSDQTFSFAPWHSGPKHSQLSVNQTATRAQGEAFPLPAQVTGSAQSADIFVEGLAAGSTLSVGRPLGSSGWWLAAADLHDASVRPPKAFVGPMDVVLELRGADDTLLDRKSMRLEWAPRQAIGAPQQPVSNPVRQLDRQEVADLIQRGNEFIVTGDLASARLVLRRAAEADDPGAALMLAATYDPVVLERVGIQGFAPDIVRGFEPDVAVARSWYGRARELGSTEALRRLEELAKHHSGSAPKE